MIPMTRPTDTTPLAQVYRKMRQHARSVQAGTHNFGTVSANAVVTQAIVFDEPFAGTPVVTVGLGTGVGGTNNQMAWSTGVGSNGFTIAGKSSSGAALVATWTAVGPGVES